jgi:hypothetical protein
MKSIKEQLVLVYCLADDCLKSQEDGGNWRKSNNKPQGFPIKSSLPSML